MGEKKNIRWLEAIKQMDIQNECWHFVSEILAKYLKSSIFYFGPWSCGIFAWCFLLWVELKDILHVCGFVDDSWMIDCVVRAKSARW